MAAESGVASDAWVGLAQPLERALGPRTAKELAKIGLSTVGDLVYHFPFRVAQRGQLLPISHVTEGESVTVIARVLDAHLRPMNSRKGFILTVRIAEGMHELSLTFFGKAMRALQFHERQLAPGTVAAFAGTISSYRGELQLTHPEYEIIDEQVDVAALEAPIPIYHSSVKLPSWKIARAVSTVLPLLGAEDFPDPLPQEYRTEHGLPSRYDAIITLHQPRNQAEWDAAAVRMKHEEAFVLQTALALQRAVEESHTAVAFPESKGGILAAFDQQLPFDLTAGQRQVGQEIASELARERPMRRLLQGDVGSGKTIVALRAMLQVVAAGGQAALLVPTEVLAWQHLHTIEALMGSLAHGGQLGSPGEATRVEILTGSLPAGAKRRALAHIAAGESGIIVGTHALLSDTVQIPFLGLVVIDEQHRFGVDQRTVLAQGSHELVMTATPIPRTIAMSVFGDLDVSLLTELPAGRAIVATTLVPASKKSWIDRVWERVAEEVARDGRVFVVCPRIDSDSVEQGESDDAQPEQLASVIDVRERLAHQFPGIAIAALHGRMSPEEKSEAMQDFISGKRPILVATTVIEVGVDVPAATCMVILDADRFGLSQLHQLRGRIGRGDRPGLCLAVTKAEEGSLAMERLVAFASTTDGFVLAEKDLELRREGDVLGADQSGRASHLQFLSVIHDEHVIRAARDASRDVFASDPTLSQHAALAAAIAQIDSDRAEYLDRA